MFFFVFSRGLFKFSRVVQSNLYLAKTATNVFFLILSFCFARFLFVLNLFSVFLYFHAVFSCII